MRKIGIILPFIIVLSISCGENEEQLTGGLKEGPSSERMTKVAIGTQNAEVGYWEYLPVGYGNGRKWPLLIFFHGVGENGDGTGESLDKLLNNGPPRHISRDEWPIESSDAGDAFVVLSPQKNGGGCPSPSDTKAFIEWAATNYEIDIARIYLTGLSCGGIGVWNYIGQYLDDDLVAAIVPIAGNGSGAWSKNGCDLGMLPIWAFHGDADGTVNVGGTNTPMNGLAGCTDPSPIDAEKTIYPGVGHNSWSRTYDLSAGHDIYTWLMSHTNPDANLD